MPSKYRRKIRIDYPDGSFCYKFVNANSYREFPDKERRVRMKALKEFDRNHTPLFAQVADEWNAEHSKEIAYYTWESYQAPLNDLKAEFVNMLIKDVLPIDLQRLLSKIEKQGRARQTIKLRKIVANQIFDYAVLKGYISANPMRSVKSSRKAPKKQIQPPTQAEINIIKQSVDLPFGLFPYFCLFTGCRRGEALAVKYDDIDFINNTISINKALIFEGAKSVIVNRTKTEAGVRVIPLLTPLKNVLDRNGQGYLFSVNGSHFSKSQFDKQWARYRRYTGLSVNVHQLRHAFATICFDAGLEPKTASRILGHSKVELTMDVYTHIRESKENEAMKKLNSFLANS
jgi:integrase